MTTSQQPTIDEWLAATDRYEPAESAGLCNREYDDELADVCEHCGASLSPTMRICNDDCDGSRIDALDDELADVYGPAMRAGAEQ